MTDRDPTSVPVPRQAWVIVAAVSVILAVAMGQLVNGLSVYFLPLEAEFGWQRGDIALINTAGLLGLATGGIVMGGIADRCGVRQVALTGVLVVGLAVLAAAGATALWQFHALFFVAGALGGGALFAPLMALIGGWFTRGAGLAIGIASAGQALGQGGIPFTGALLIEAFGWRGAFAVQGIATLVLLVPLALLLREATPRHAGGRPDDTPPAPLPNAATVAAMSGAVLFCCTCMSVPLMHLVPLIQGRGFDAPQAGGVLFVMLMVAIAGRIAFGRLADMIGALPAWIVASAWQTLMVFGFTLIDGLTAFYVYAVIYGFGYAGVMTSVLATARELTPPARRAMSTGIVVAFGWLGHGLGGYQGGLFYDLTGGYGWTYANAAVAGALNLTILVSLLIAIRGGGRAASAA